MHRLRHRIFVEQLKWPLGPIQSVNGLEYDQFDTPSAHYIVHLNKAAEVDACARLLSTEGPNLLSDVFPDLVAGIIPKRADTWEISRFCSDATSAPKNILGLLLAVVLEYGLANDVKHYVSVSDIRIEPLLRRAGWCPVRLGGTLQTTTETVAAEHFVVSPSVLQRVREKFRMPIEESLQLWIVAFNARSCTKSPSIR